MKKSLIRIINYINNIKFDNIYLISENSMCNKMYINYISKYIDTDKYKIIEVTEKRLLGINKITENNLIILCGRWYLNRIAKKNDFNRFIAEYFKASIPFDEIEID
ncbi:hypothetical protein [Clostridium tertium]|uniref:hypothetical protein n=1 Tax=Clostridium tertium TaxID=1559 RepID=UPI001AE9E965|nr:hypothetical protein [Clostridium tertium]MBP1869342.1 hypothetical protein [Clostridium tertium]